MADKTDEINETDEIAGESGIQCRTLWEMLLYKLDRSIAVAGIVAVGIYSIYAGPDMKDIAMGVATGLGVFLGMKGK
jgi:hypothetical protein